MSSKSRKILFRIGMAAAGLLIAFYALFPVFWLILASFKGAAELNSLPVTFWPQEPTLDAYRDLFASGTQSAQLLDWRQLIVNSFFVSITSTIIVIVLGTFAGYAFARINFPGRDVILGSLLISRMFQGAALLLPTFRLMNTIGLYDSLWGLVLLYSAFGLPFATWIIASGLKEIPKELEESAFIDGATRLQSMFIVVLPLAVPALITASMWHFVGAWSEFAFASILIETVEKKTVTIGLASFVDYFSLEFNRVGAAASLVALPVMLLFLMGQRYFSRGLMQGAVKG